MATRLVQLHENGAQVVAMLGDDGTAARLGAETIYSLAREAIARGETLAEAARRHSTGAPVDLAAAAREHRLLAPVAHPDPAHCYLTGTGLTHLGSAEGRDRMHKAAAGGRQTDSMRMFAMGLEGGKPGSGVEGVQPEWFYKGDGTAIVATGQPLTAPAFALDGSEEPEIAGIYLIGDDGTPWRLGFALANEFSDHVTERGNYLWLAHSKLRPAAIGPELLLGALPHSIVGTSRIRRGNAILWEQRFLSGEANMSHSVANLEAHHFKYSQFCQPGDVHIHFFGTATLSFTDGIITQPGDIFEIAAAPFLFPLSNPLGRAWSAPPVVRVL